MLVVLGGKWMFSKYLNKQYIDELSVRAGHFRISCRLSYLVYVYRHTHTHSMPRTVCVRAVVACFRSVGETADCLNYRGLYCRSLGMIEVYL